MGPCYGPFDSGGVCSMGPIWYIRGPYSGTIGSTLEASFTTKGSRTVNRCVSPYTLHTKLL